MENMFLRLATVLALSTGISVRSKAEVLVNNSSSVKTGFIYEVGIICEENTNLLATSSKFFCGLNSKLGYKWDYGNDSDTFCGCISKFGFKLDFGNQNTIKVNFNRNFVIERKKRFVFAEVNNGKFSTLTNSSKIFYGSKYTTSYELDYNNGFFHSNVFLGCMSRVNCKTDNKNISTINTKVKKFIDITTENTNRFINIITGWNIIKRIKNILSIPTFEICDLGLNEDDVPWR